MQVARKIRRGPFFGVIAVVISACSQGVPLAPAYGASSLLAKSQALLYVSSYYGYLKIYTFPQGKAAGSIPISGVPEELCSDKAGDIFVPESYGQIVVEYAHGGTEPIATFPDHHTPYGCAVDPTTGNLAVTNSNKDIVVFTRTLAPPALYSNSALESYYSTSYDDQSNLFAIAEPFSGGSGLYEVKKGSSTIHQVSVPFTICCPNPIRWDGTYLAVAGSHQSNNAIIYRLKISDYKATVEGKLTLDGGASYVSQIWIDGKNLITTADYSEDIGFWKYPAGGAAWKTLTNAGPDINGITVSNPSK
ncbi:MAG: hypothetical protein ABSD52_14575 [Candidatus Cybelea sp.]|jgi:hypothetical protein